MFALVLLWQFGVSKLIEAAFITKEKAEMMGISTDREGMWVGYEIDRTTEVGKQAWAMVKSGERPALSIVGSGKRVALA